MKAWISSNFGKFAIDLRPLIDFKIEFLLNILKKIDRLRLNLYTHNQSLFFANLQQSYGP